MTCARHPDSKPSEVLVDAKASDCRPKMTRFGPLVIEVLGGYQGESGRLKLRGDLS
jgi:hypothetical protein